jgi:ATP-dependent Lon protease
MKNHVEFLDVHEFVGLLERCNPGKEEEKTVSRWATMLLENGRKTFGALRTEVLDARLDELAQHHPNFAEVIGWFEAELAFAKVAGHGLEFQRLLLVGPPGTGKTTFSLELAEALGVPSEVVAMNQRQAGSFLTGTEQHWANTQPGAVFRLLARSQVINPIMVLDEIEKAAKDPRWDPLAGLYTLLERRTAREFADAALPDVHLNASHMNWIATANSTEDLNSALLSRFNTFEIRRLTADEMTALVRRMYARLIDENPGVRTHIDGQLPADVSDALVGAMESGRDIDRVLRRIVGHALQTGERLNVGMMGEMVAAPVTARQKIGFV